MRTAATVIVYHAVGTGPPGADWDTLFVSPHAFAWQMSYLERRRRVVSLAELTAGVAEHGGKPAVAITFDDGFRSVLKEAAPVLERHGFPATVFVPTRWLEDPGQPAEHTRGAPLELLSQEDVVELKRRGLELGSHGHTHADLARLSAATVESELRTSISRLEELVGERPRFLAWPYGQSSDAARQAAQAAGLEAAFTLEQVDGGRYAMARVPIERQDGRTGFALKTSGRYARLAQSGVVRKGVALLRPRSGPDASLFSVDRPPDTG
jgi:peptidoglycan/xylan/chitin deacetylase (PgdA/CDA1 family)